MPVMFLGQSECISGFTSRDRVRDLSRMVGGKLRTRERQQRIIPMTNFTCSGSINKWNGGGYMLSGKTLAEKTVQNDNQYSSNPDTKAQTIDTIGPPDYHGTLPSTSLFSYILVETLTLRMTCH